MHRPLNLLSTLMVVGLLAVGCSDDYSDTGAHGRTLVGSQLRFEPASIVVRAGEPVQLILTNPDIVDHDLVLTGIPATNIDDDSRRGSDGEDGDGEGSHDHGAIETGRIVGHAVPGGRARIWFTPVQPGRYTFYCSLPGHREAGMQGTLVVE